MGELIFYGLKDGVISELKRHTYMNGYGLNVFQWEDGFVYIDHRSDGYEVNGLRQLRVDQIGDSTYYEVYKDDGSCKYIIKRSRDKLRFATTTEIELYNAAISKAYSILVRDDEEKLLRVIALDGIRGLLERFKRQLKKERLKKVKP